jgi:hypothetical protein
MGANAQTTVPTFTAAQVLTADQMNQSARTGVPVFADTTARDAGFGGSGEKTLAEGQLCYLESTNVVQYYDGAAWATVGPSNPGGLIRVGGGTLSGTATNFQSVFSATYQTYQIVISGITGSDDNINAKLLSGATAIVTNYGGARYNVNDGGTATVTASGTTLWERVGYAGSNQGAALIIWISNPFLACQTMINSWFAYDNAQGWFAGNNTNATSYDGIRFEHSTFSAGTVNIYGYSLS